MRINKTTNILYRTKTFERLYLKNENLILTIFLL